jgi:antitoxin MazE
MRVELVRIGNSRGIRIPKPLIDQFGFGATVDLRVERDCLVITSDRQSRRGWDKAFQSSRPTTEDDLRLMTLSNDFDSDEWEW